jgi:MoaA/NifB/PqqE/SkfB family radical SAM enzyme
LIALKQAGFYVGSTSNCTVLTQEKAEEIMDCGLDYLGISFDVNHSRGLHNHLEAVVGKLEAICRSRDTRHKEMKIGINVVLFRTEKERLFEFLDWLQGYPVWSISVAPLIMIPDQAFFSELTSRKELEDLQSRVRERFPDLPVSFGYLETEMQRNCRSDVFHNVYVDYMGNVCPCCVLAMGFPNVTFDGQRRQTEILHFGNLTRSHIQTIWDGQLYSDFRAMFAHNTIPEHCQCCNAWRVLPSSLVSEELGI